MCLLLKVHCDNKPASLKLLIVINDGKVIYRTALTGLMMRDNLHPPCDPVLSRKLLRLNSVFLEARNWINLCNKNRMNTSVKIITVPQCMFLSDLLALLMLWEIVWSCTESLTSFPWTIRWCVVTRALNTTIQLAFPARSNSVSAIWGMLTLDSWVAWIRSAERESRRKNNHTSIGENH